MLRISAYSLLAFLRQFYVLLSYFFDYSLESSELNSEDSLNLFMKCQ